MKSEIKQVSKKEILSIIDTYAPKGKFYTDDIDCFVAVDNSTEEAWTEEFETRAQCIEWLLGGMSADEVRNQPIKLGKLLEVLDKDENVKLLTQDSLVQNIFNLDQVSEEEQIKFSNCEVLSVFSDPCSSMTIVVEIDYRRSNSLVCKERL